MKILVISDIHGNLAALNAIREDADMIFCLGDIVNYGPYPKDCLERIRNLTNLAVRGNHDNAIGRGMDCGCSVRYKTLSDVCKKFTTGIINDCEKEYLGNLPVVLTIEAGGAKFLLSHGSPGGDIYKYLRADDPNIEHELQKETEGLNADFVFIGHTHLPMIRKIKDITVINPGSVGQPRDGNPKASYAIWEDGHIE